MPKHLVSFRVTKHGKFHKTHVAEINAPTADDALRHLLNRCKAGREYRRKFPGCTFSELQVLPLYPIPVTPHSRVISRDAEPTASELLYSTTDPYEQPLVMPAWARDVPELAKQIDDGHKLRRAAGLPIDGSFPAEGPGCEQPDWFRYAGEQFSRAQGGFLQPPDGLRAEFFRNALLSSVHSVLHPDD